MSHNTNQSSSSNGTVYLTVGWILFAISLLFAPILFGAGAIVMGYLTYKRYNKKQGVILIIMAIVGIIIGTLIGIYYGMQR